MRMVDEAPFWAMAVLALSGLAACSGAPAGASGDGGCARDLPASCPSPVPSWTTDVQPAIERSCAPCHLPGGIAAPLHDFSMYAGVYGQRGSVLGAVSSCRMPLAGGAAPLAPADREKLLAWLVCGAPQN
jgi:hypothetical protein